MPTAPVGSTTRPRPLALARAAHVPGPVQESVGGERDQEGVDSDGAGTAQGGALEFGPALHVAGDIEVAGGIGCHRQDIIVAVGATAGLGPDELRGRIRPGREGRGNEVRPRRTRRGRQCQTRGDGFDRRERSGVGFHGFLQLAHGPGVTAGSVGFGAPLAGSACSSRSSWATSDCSSSGSCRPSRSKAIRCLQAYGGIFVTQTADRQRDGCGRVLPHGV
jgi:hypothetical protein